MDPFPPTKQQQAVITHRGGNLLVFAGPGTGKTETLARRFAAVVADGVAPSQILMLTFSRRSADEMRDRVLLRLRQLHAASLAVPELFVKTFHGFCGRLLDGDNPRLQHRDLMTPVKERLLWRKVMRSGSLALSSFDAGVIESNQFATDCLNVIAHLKGQGVDAARLTNLARGDQRLSDIAEIFAAMETERTKAHLRDYRDLVNEAVSALADPKSVATRWLRNARFLHVLVDEFQDSDAMQLRLLETMRSVMSPTPLFCFVGDVNQSIYRFRGASPGNVEVARTAFACETLPLRDNRRSAQAILDVANADATLDGNSLTTAADRDKRGGVLLGRPRTIDDEVGVIRDAIVAKVAASVAPRSIAVLLRQTRPYQELIIDALSDAGVAVAALPAAGFHEDALVDAVLTALRLLAASDDERLWRRLLSNPIVGFRPIDLRFAFDAGRRAGIADERAMLRINPPGGVRDIGDFLGAWKRCGVAYDKASPLELVQTIVYELDLLRPVRERTAVNGFDRAASPLRLDALLQAAEDYSDLKQSKGSDRSDLTEFISRLDETIGLLADATQPPPSIIEGVRVMSIHAAKGLEFDFVVIPQLIDGLLPASERPNRLLSDSCVRKLTSAGISVSLDHNDARREEHSLWYVALTRARAEVLVTAARVDDEGVDQTLSPFALAIQQTVDDEVTVDTGSTATDGAVTVDITSTVDARSTATEPIVLSMDTLSPSGISDFLTCPRRFFYRDVLRLPARDDDATKYGRVLHQVLRRFHEVETNFEQIGDPSAAAGKYRTMLREIVAEETAAESADIGLGPLARYEREDLERRLDMYAQDLAEEAASEPFAVLATERSVVSSFENVTVRGQADRVDRLARGGLVVRDYKSGRIHAYLLATLRRALDRLDEGENIFGDAPEGLNLQTILYVPGVEQAFGERVRRLDYLYFRGKSTDEGDLLVDKTLIAQSGDTDSNMLTREQIERVGRDIAFRIVAMCRDGELLHFPTAHDERTCTFCSFTRICPGAGALA
ncbi:MAG TPA: ATP-dependent DNA helicase [Candidatus Eremiobacteraceae bacterium]|nr:ATP-dependent DNA helicase [Candidatus Eremiobacteraceae bacterium]